MQKDQAVFSNETSKRWLLVMILILLVIPLLLSSIYFLYIPVGYQGGRNPIYNQVVFFDRHNWDIIHLWSGVGMILILVIHIIVHWKWMSVMLQHCFNRESCNIGRLNHFARLNIILDIVAAFSFLLASVSGIFLLFAAKGAASKTAEYFLLSKFVWDTIHTWSGVVMFITAILHLYIHWRWVRQVSRRMLKKEINPKPVIQGS